MGLIVTIGMRTDIRVEVYNNAFQMTDYPISSTVNTALYWYYTIYNIIVNDLALSPADRRSQA